MRIISKFRDYYDCIMREGMDLTQVWVREKSVFYCEPKTQTKQKMEWPFPKMHLFHNKLFGQKEETLYIVGFCGKLYPAFKWSGKDESLCWDMEQIDEHHQRTLSESQFKDYKRNKWVTGFRPRQKYQKFFDELASKEKSLERLFIEHNTPVFIAKEGSWLLPTITFNACLQDEVVDFIKKFDPYQAYQEIQMYFGSVLLGSDGHKSKYKGQMIEPEIDDVTKAESKGFNQWSFRKEPKAKKKPETKS
jgi:hypothetical protein